MVIDADGSRKRGWGKFRKVDSRRSTVDSYGRTTDEGLRKT